MLVNYLHFYGGFERIATNRQWYAREVRCIRLGRDIGRTRTLKGSA